MQQLEDLLSPLHDGVWEVVVRKNEVQTPLSEHWVRSRLNIPSPGTIASYRHGQYHLHETATEFRVHLDRYDPREHPILHLADDAPLVLMVIDTFAALISDSRKTLPSYTATELSEQAKTWRLIVLTGIVMLLLGTWIITEPVITFGSLLALLVPAGFFLLSIPFFKNAIHLRPFGIQSAGRLVLGFGIVLLGINALFAEVLELQSFVLLVLAAWTLASAWFSLGRTLHGPKAVPEGFWLRLVVGILSAMLAFLILFLPEAAIELLMLILGAVVLAIGLSLLVEGIGLWMRMQRRRPSEV
ncbi:MAG: hypothetical protein D5R99_05305 [Methanocalculus sp. MSAO_Arc1]|uniref:HdeD family acid-resistance protein n=1 Tax=Methanocalculus TaxID=71151 RepID=UPI000FF06495|nr:MULTISPECIES: hypothetical protein [unclassified Methanocalculus]MCP1662669.1 uncharacterized membrane protein HdeD (DUF308 family) [Methanocalculus sp. AMF5]RQD80300.1 MAG: hypothetical protein D5R99_05305 [Methanocalculus sp. MSAO_Arc1]